MRFKKLASLVLLLLAGSIGYSSPPEVPATLSADPGQLVRIVVKTPVDDKGVVLDFGYLKNFGDSDAFWGELVSPVKGERHFVFQAPTKNPKSQYVLGFFTKGEVTGNTTTIIVVPPDPTPYVPPGPNPPNPPVPNPQGVGAFVIVVVDENSPTQAQEKVAQGVTLSALKVAGKCRVYGNVSDADKIKTKHFDQMMTDAKLSPPAAFILDKQGKMILSAKLPTDDTTMSNWLKGVMTP